MAFRLKKISLRKIVAPVRRVVTPVARAVKKVSIPNVKKAVTQVVKSPVGAGALGLLGAKLGGVAGAAIGVAAKIKGLGNIFKSPGQNLAPQAAAAEETYVPAATPEPAPSSPLTLAGASVLGRQPDPIERFFFWLAGLFGGSGRAS